MSELFCTVADLASAYGAGVIGASRQVDKRQNLLKARRALTGQEHTKMIISSSHAWLNNGVSQLILGVVVAAFGAYLFVSV